MKKILEKHSIKTGFGFGLTSGVITTLGLIVGLYSGTQSKLAVIGGILTIAITDALSDALGIHISEEAKNKSTQLEIWESTISTFIFKLIFASTFIIPVLLTELFTAVMISVIWGMFLLGIFSYFIGKQQKIKPTKIILEHLIIAIIVIILTYSIGNWINKVFF